MADPRGTGGSCPPPFVQEKVVATITFQNVRGACRTALEPPPDIPLIKKLDPPLVAHQQHARLINPHYQSPTCLVIARLMRWFRSGTLSSLKAPKRAVLERIID